MTPVIRIDDEVWKQLQDRAEALVDTPNDVLRRLLKLNMNDTRKTEISGGTKHVESQRDSGQNSSIFIIVNAAGQTPNQDNAIAGRDLTMQRIKSGVDIQAFRRFSRARKLLKPGARVVMHQGGAHTWRNQYGSGQLQAAGIVKAVGLPLSEEDKQSSDYKMAKKFYPTKPLAGKAIYDFPKGVAKQPLPKEDVPYNPGRGDNFIEIKPGDPRYQILDTWWAANS